MALRPLTAGPSLRFVAVLAALIALLPALAAAQQARLAGTVYDLEGAVAGAVVRLVDAGGGRSEATTDGAGAYLLAGLGSGRQAIEVTKAGYQPSVGEVVLAEGEAPTRLDVELRRLDERVPGGPASGVDATLAAAVRRWLELGNRLLEQGRGEAAQAEFEKALPWLDPAGAAEAHRALARCRYLAEDVEGTVGQLEQAVGAEVRAGLEAGELGQSSSYQLLRTLLEQLGRTDELEQRVEAATRDASDALAAAAPPAPRAPSREPEAPVRLTRDATGRLRVAIPSGTTAPDVAELRRRLGDAHFAAESSPRGARGGALDLSDESLALFVPAVYGEEGAARRQDEPWGLLVWVSPTPGGMLPADPALEELLAQRRVLWVGAERSGNRRPSWQRAALALVAADVVLAHYDVDPERVWVGGYSGGGRMASALVWRWPERFRGGIFWFGADFFADLPVPFRPGARWTARFPSPGRDEQRLLRQRRFVYVTGERDFNRSETLVVSQAARERGYEGVTYLQVPGADHYLGLDAEWLGRALEAVE